MPAYDADEAAADAARAAKEQALMYQQVSHLADRKVAAEQAHGDYLRAHPALGPLLADLTRAVLLAKPPSIFALAARHFAAVGERGGAKPPTLARGPPPLVVCGAAQARIFDLVSRRFPKLFRAPLVTTSRPPRRGERPGVTCDFTTAAMLARDAAAGKYFEHGADEHGAAAGTTLEAVAAVRALGLVPLLHLP
ncbi:hypothetical protein M885DRAFT_520458 [Pelagophyceae sp. CCMP2097]|nr:hypothetical protein M885DRAFT_520458 [Pelagophyceae sp. CCMP2097]